MTSSQRTAGALTLLGIVVAIAWRVGIAPAVLGDFDPADMPHRDRAFLALGNVGVAFLFTAAMWCIARMHEGKPARRHARIAVSLAAAASACALLSSIGLIWFESAGGLLYGYLVLIGCAWALVCYSLFRARRGPVRWMAVTTGALYALAILAIAAGATIIFVMTVAAAPLAIALLVSSEKQSAIAAVTAAS